MRATHITRFRLWAAFCAQVTCCVAAFVCYVFFLDTPGEDAGVAVFLSACMVSVCGLAATYTHVKIKGQEMEETPNADLTIVLITVAVLCLLHFILQPPMSGEEFQKWMDELSAPQPLPFE